MKLLSGNFGRHLVFYAAANALTAWANMPWYAYLFPVLLLFLLSTPTTSTHIFRFSKSGQEHFPPLFGDRGVYFVNGQIEFRPIWGSALSFPISSLEDVVIDVFPRMNYSSATFYFTVNGAPEHLTLERSPLNSFYFRLSTRTFTRWVENIPALEQHVRSKILGGKVVAMERPYAEKHLGKLNFRWHNALEVNGQKVDAVAVESATGRSDFILTTPVGKAMAASFRALSLSELFLVRMLLRGELGFAAPQIEQPANFWERDIFSLFRRR